MLPWQLAENKLFLFQVTKMFLVLVVSVVYYNSPAISNANSDAVKGMTDPQHSTVFPTEAPVEAVNADLLDAGLTGAVVEGALHLRL